jgi:hypothetical protein
MPRHTKILTLTALWLTLTLSAAFATTAWWPRLILAAVGIGVTVHLLRLKTYEPGKDKTIISPSTPSPLPSEDA